MLGIAFIVANLLITKELQRRGQDVAIATTVTMLGLVGGVVGAKLFDIFENWDTFLAHPRETIFSASGLTFYGGFLLATLLITIYLRRRKMRMLQFADIAAPALAIAYGIGRIGCQLAGDGDYGIPTTLPWAMTYPKGMVSTLASKNPGLAAQFTQLFPNQTVPVDIPVHPAPLYEIALAAGVFSILFLRRKKDIPVGNQFGVFLVLHGLCRFGVEFIRLNPLLAFGLSQAQIISLGLVVWGIALLARPRPAPATTRH
jgi:phosphatidylglycerol:prolipoprotein diacylglycerol transferase